MKKFKTAKKILSVVLVMVMTFSGIGAYVAQAFEMPEIAHEHIFDNWVIKEYPNCKTGGYKTRTCLYCTETETQVMPADRNAHIPGDRTVIKAATCQEKGVDEYVCQNPNCKVTYRVETPTIDHNFPLDENGNEIWTVVVKQEHMEKLARDGILHSNCETCGLTISKTVPVEHDFNGAIPDVRKKADCTEEGYQYTVCNVCHMNIRSVIPVDHDAHVYSGKAKIISEEFNCKTDGRGIVVCEKCNKTAEVNVPKETAHDYVEWTVVNELPDGATCLNGLNGLERRMCGTCGVELEFRSITAPHKFTTKNANGEIVSTITGTVNSTCSQRGYDVGNCSLCGKGGVKNYHSVDANAHNWAEFVITAPTCTSEGKLFRMCKYDSSHIEDVVIPKSDHVYAGEWEIEPENCREDGYKRNTCAVCKQVITIILPKDPDAHNFDGQTWTVEKASTCDTHGEERASCRICHEVISRELPFCYNTGYYFKTTAPTCFKEGSIQYSCSECGRVRTVSIPIDPDAHVPSNGYKEIKSATCQETGIKTRVCVNCDAEITENQIVIPQLLHTMKEFIDVYPTCDEDGVKHHECQNAGCDHRVENLKIPAAHNYTAWSYEGTPNCETPVTRTRNCYRCHIEDKETNFYGNHLDAEWTFKMGSCASGGLAVKICGACGDEYDPKTVAAGEHIDLELISETLPQTSDTCFGQKLKCKDKNCGQIVLVTYPHNYIIVEKGYEATCALPGLTDSKYCAVCKYKLEQTVIPKLDHSFAYDSNGTKYCTKCNLYYVEDGIACNHFCHNQSTMAKIMTKIFAIFWKMFGINHFCKCGIPHYHEDEATLKITGKNLTGKLIGVYSCTECKVKDKDIVLK